MYRLLVVWVGVGLVVQPYLFENLYLIFNIDAQHMKPYFLNVQMVEIVYYSFLNNLNHG